jgi:cell shape-determining protein MreC
VLAVDALKKNKGKGVDDQKDSQKEMADVPKKKTSAPKKTADVIADVPKRIKERLVLGQGILLVIANDVTNTFR